MTYVIGMHCPQLKLNIILCDTKFAAADKIEGREAPALKNGLLFDGCMYGAAGNVDHIMRFVSDCKADLGNIKGAKEAFWEFTKVLREYDFWEYDDFELILSTNYGGQPTLYLLDPKTEDRLILGEIAEQANMTFASIGSGKPLLDSAFAEYLQDHGKVGGSPDPEDLAYGWCAWFVQYARGDKALELEKVGVGGYFHFWVQTETETKPQNTCLYVLFAIFQGIIWPYYYRIGYLQNGEILVVNDLHEGDLHVIKNVWTSDDRFLITDDIDPRRCGEFHYTVSKYNTNSLIIKEIVEQYRSSPLYYFCSFGFAHPAHQLRINHINKTNTNAYA